MTLDFTWVDWALLAVFTLSVVIGVVRGFVFEVMSLLGWVVAFVLAQAFSGEVALYLPIGEQGTAVNRGAAFALTFIAALLIWVVLSRLVRLLIHATPLSLIDRFLGAAFGGARGMLLLLVVAIVVAMTPWSQSPTWQASVAAPWLQSALIGLKPMFPESFSKHLPA